VDAVDEFLESLDPAVLQRLDAKALAELAGVFPALRSFDPGSGEPTTAGERFRAHRAVSELLERLAQSHAVVLGLDDLHWADSASLELLARLLRRRPRANVIVVGTFRKGQLHRTLLAAIGHGLRETDLHLTLGPLRRGEARGLVEETDDEHYAALYEASGGNPFYLLELARLGGQRHDLSPDGGAAGVPAAVSAATLEELDALSRAGRELAEGAAIAGDPFELGLAARSAGLPEPEALDALDELVARDLVHPTEVPRRFRFRHPLVRRAVYESCAPGTRIAAHGRCAGALEERGAPVAARAHHVEHSGRVGDLGAVALLSEAGEATSRRAPVSAARWFSAALGLLPDTAPRDERVGLLMALAGAQAATGRFDDSRAALLESIELTSDTDPALRVRLTASCATVEQLLGRHEEARARLTRELESTPASSSPEAVELMMHLAAGDFYRMDYEGMRDWGERALVVAETLDESLAAASLAVLAVAAAFIGPVSEAQAFRSTAAVLVDSLPDDRLEARLDAVSNLSAANLYLHRYDDAAALAARGLAVAAASGQGDIAPFLTPVLITVLHNTGRIAEAAEMADESIEAARLSGNVEALGWALLSRAFVGVAAGDLDLALELATESVEATRELDDRLVSTYARWALASALLEAGEAERAAGVFLAAAEGDELPRIPEGWRAHYLELLTRCWLAVDRPADAERAAERALAIAGRLDCKAATAMAHRASAAVALAAGDPAAAAERARTAAAAGFEAGARVDAARSRTLAGRALAAAGEREQAVAELEVAARELGECGAARYRAKAEHELRRLGLRFSSRTRPHDPDSEGVDTLTPREREVALLVVDRHTNPQIARTLVLSEKTIETHMRNIFRKLEVSSRADVARTLERAERVSSG
jgi:DNA-binding NarL/FixJ family response regulator